MSILNESNFLRKKILSSYSIPINKAIHLVTVDPETLPVGSFVFREQKYPGDIDIREEIKECCDRKTAVKKIVKDIQNIIKNVAIERGYYVADFKAGLDFRYPNDRDKYILRWDEKELLQGYKILPGNIKKTLEEAIQDPTIVKLDVWAPINQRYVEVSNFMILVEEDKNGNQILLNGEQPDYLQSIKGDIQLYFSPQELNAFKATKREWLIAVTLNDTRVLQLIHPLITGDPGIFYQVVSDMKTLADMIDKLKTPPYAFIYKEIDNFRTRLSFVNDIEFDEQMIDEIIEYILLKQLKGKQLVIELDKMVDYLMDILNQFTLNYDKMYGLYPPPPLYQLNNINLKGGKLNKKISRLDALKFLKKIKFNIKKSNIKLKDLIYGMNIELEHGNKYPFTNVTNNDLIKTGKIALVHLLEKADYYDRLKKYVEAGCYYCGAGPGEMHHEHCHCEQCDLERNYHCHDCECYD